MMKHRFFSSHMLVATMCFVLLCTGLSSAFDWELSWSSPSTDDSTDYQDLYTYQSCDLDNRYYDANDSGIVAHTDARVETEIMPFYFYGAGSFSGDTYAYSTTSISATWDWSGPPGTAPAAAMKRTRKNYGWLWCGGHAQDDYGTIEMYVASNGTIASITTTQSATRETSGTLAGIAYTQAQIASAGFTSENANGWRFNSTDIVTYGYYELESLISFRYVSTYLTSPGLSSVGATATAYVGSTSTVDVEYSDDAAVGWWATGGVDGYARTSVELDG